MTVFVLDSLMGFPAGSVSELDGVRCPVLSSECQIDTESVSALLESRSNSAPISPSLREPSFVRGVSLLRSVDSTLNCICTNLSDPKIDDV